MAKMAAMPAYSKTVNLFKMYIIGDPGLTSVYFFGKVKFGLSGF